jgi:hypothetical protein
MRKITLLISVAAASLLVTACGDPNKAAKDATTEADAATTEAPVGDAAAANAVDGKMAAPETPTANAAVVDDKGGDPGAQ